MTWSDLPLETSYSHWQPHLSEVVAQRELAAKFLISLRYMSE